MAEGRSNVVSFVIGGIVPCADRRRDAPLDPIDQDTGRDDIPAPERSRTTDSDD